ncbi:MAG: O-antigen ligase family protein [Thermoanaerobaculales bacterium]|jgi:hypothetical protein|nr:O-antigen ligase family protein [Thermoanaerobaculales bacterium]
MTRRIEFAPALAAGTLVFAAVWGGAFRPGQWLLVGGFLVVVWLAAAREDRLSLDPWELMVVAALVWAAASAAVVGAAPLASKETILGWTFAWLMWRIGWGAGGVSRTVALQVLAGGAAVVALAVLWQAVVSGEVRTGGFFENPNLAAAILVASLAATPARSPLIRYSWLILVVAATVLTGSRAGLLAMVAAAAVVLPRGRMRIVGVAAAATAGIAAVGWRLFSLPDVLAWHRVSIWRAVLEIWSARPVTGVGPGCLVEAAGVARMAYPNQVGKYQFVVSVAESTPLAILVQVGVIGFVLAASAIWLWVRNQRSSGSFSLPSFRACLAAVCVVSLFHDLLTVPVVLWWWALTLGCSAGDRREASVELQARARPGLRAAMALVVIWLTAWAIVAPAAAKMQMASIPVSTAEVERLTRIEPWYDEPAAALVDRIIADPTPWTWESAAEGLFWAREAVRLHPGLARRWADLGKVHLRVLTDLGGTVHDVGAARSALAHAAALDPHLPWHWLERARLERVAGEHEAALRYVHHALEEEPNTVRGWLMLCRLELERGHVNVARQALEEATSRAKLGGTPGLTPYELELVALPRDAAAVLARRLEGE